MKKLLSILLCLAMVLSLTFVLAGCNDDKKDDKKEESSASDKDEDKDTDKDTDKGSDKDEDKDSDKDADKEDGKKEDTIVGAWECSMSADEMYGEESLKSLFGPAGEYMDFSSLKISMTYEFDDDGVMTLSMDAEGFLEDYLAICKKGLTEYAESQGKTFEEFLEADGTDWDALVAMLSEAFGGDATSMEFSYKLDGDKLYTWAEGYEMDEDDYFEVELDGDKLELTKDGIAMECERK